MEKILLVEDDEMISEIYQRKLTQAGYEVETAMDENQAQKKIRLYGYDLVLLDLVLPGIDGISILKEISHDGSIPLPSPTVIFSNLNDMENQEAAFRFGVSGFISKSQFNPSEFLREIERYLREIREQKKNGVLPSSRETQIHQEGVRDEGIIEKKLKEKHIVFVEDEEVFVNLFSEKLQREGFRLTICSSGVEAMDVIKMDKPDIVVTDLLLPSMRGDELVENLRKNQETKDIPIVVISASALDQQEESVKKMGIQGFFLKTHITPSELLEHIRTLLKK